MSGYNYKDKIQIISIADGSAITTLEPIGSLRVRIVSMAYSPDGISLAVRASNRILVWQTSEWNLLPAQDTISSGPSLGRPFNLNDFIAWSPDSQLLAMGLQNGDILVLNVQNGQKATLSGHTLYVTGVAFSPDGTFLASISLDGTVMIWGLR